MTIGDKLIPAYVAFMVVAYYDPPGILGHRTQAGDDFAGGTDLLGGLVSTEYVHAGIGGIRQHSQHTGMSQPPPNNLSIPHATIRASWEAQTSFLKAAHHTIGSALFRKQSEDCANRALNLHIWIDHNLVVRVDEPNRQRKPELAAVRLVEFTTMEARADNM